MSEEIPETADGAIRGWMVAVGFTLVLIGGELMAEKEGVRFWTGVGLAIAALPCYLLVAWWKTLKPKLNERSLATLNRVATDARWWMGLLFLVLFGFIISPFIEQRRWPYSLGEIAVTISEATPKAIPPLSRSNWSLKAALANDFPGTLQHNGEVSLQIDGQAVNVQIIDFRDPHDGAEFLGVYIPRTVQTASIARQVFTEHQSLLKQLGQGGIAIRAYGQEGDQNADQTIFTKRIFVYYDGDLSLQQRAELEKYSDSLGVKTIFRGKEYLATEQVARPDISGVQH